MPASASGPPSLSSSSRRDFAGWMTVLLLTAAAALLRFHALARKSFWFDEGVSVAVARLNGYNFARLLWRREANMSLYYLLLRGWLHFGHSEFFVRTLSVLPALATLPVVYWLGRELFCRRVGLAATMLLAVNAYHIRYAQEARSYSLYVFLSTLSCALFVNYLRQPGSKSRGWHVLVSALAVYAHFYAGLIIVAQWLSLRLRTATRTSPETRANWKWIGALIVPALLFAATTGVGPLSWIQRPGPSVLYEYYRHLAGNGGAVLLCLYLLAIGAALWPVAGELLRRPAAPTFVWRYQFLLMWLLFPVLATVTVSVARPMFVARYFVVCLPALVLLAGAGLDRLPRIWLGLTLGLLLALSLKGTLSYYDHDFDLDRDDYRTAANYVLDHAQPGDVILFHIAMGRMPYEFYRSLYDASRPVPVVIYPSRGGEIDYRDFIGKPSPAFLQGAASSYDRVWVVLKNNQGPNGPDPTTQALDAAFNAAHVLAETDRFPGVEVRLYRR